MSLGGLTGSIVALQNSGLFGHVGHLEFAPVYKLSVNCGMREDSRENVEGPNFVARFLRFKILDH